MSHLLLETNILQKKNLYQFYFKFSQYNQSYNAVVALVVLEFYSSNIKGKTVLVEFGKIANQLKTKPWSFANFWIKLKV